MLVLDCPLSLIASCNSLTPVVTRTEFKRSTVYNGVHNEMYCICQNQNERSLGERLNSLEITPRVYFIASSELIIYTYQLVLKYILLLF